MRLLGADQHTKVRVGGVLLLRLVQVRIPKNKQRTITVYGFNVLFHDNLVNEPVLLGFLGRHEVIAVCVLFHGLQVLTGVFGQ